MSGSRHGKLGVAAVAAVALVAAGAALAASKLHGSTSSARAGFGATALADYGTGAVELRHQSYGLRRGFGFGHGPGDELQVAADYLGTTVSALITQLQSGKTLAQVADSTSGKSSAGLVDALVEHEQAQLAQAVKDGKLTQSQADQISANLKTHITALVNGTFPHGPGIGLHPGHGPGDELQAAADYLGTTVSALITQVQSGKTLAQIADSTSGKSSAGLVDALVKHEQAELAQAVKDGKLTQSQADQISTNLESRMTALVNGTLPPHGPGFGPGHGPGDELQAAADYLGTTVGALITQLQSGKTLAQIADSTSGKSSAGLVDALVEHEQAELAKAVKDGMLTQSQADQISANLKTRMTALVNGTGGDHGGFGHHGFGPGPGYGGTPPTAPSQSTPPAHI